MTRFRSLKVLAAVLVVCTPLAAEERSSPIDAPLALRVEHAHEPLGIDVERPRLSWRLSASERDQRQSAYRILVASSRARLESDEGDLWDSGKVQSDRSIFVPYGGDRMKSGARYWWKVRVWDGSDRPTAYSEPSWWETGLLDARDWKGEWISAPPVFDWRAFVARARALSENDPPVDDSRAPLLRRTFRVRGDVASARLYISGLGYYEAYLDGSRVGDRVLDPAFTRYDRTVLYSTYDVTSMLHPGENAIGVMLGTGWYDMPTRAVWGFDHAPWRDRPVVRAMLEIRYQDGTRQRVVSDDRWRAAPGPVVFNSIRQGEIYDARLEKPGWTTAGFDDSGWRRALVDAGPAGELTAQSLPPIRVVEGIDPVSVSEPVPGRYVFDLGQNIAGWVRIRVAAEAGRRITLEYGERLKPDGTVDQEAIGVHLRARPIQTDVYIAKGDDLEVWEPRFAYHGFRYVQVTGLATPPTRGFLEGRVVHTDFARVGTWSSSDELLDAIQRAAVWSYRGNFHGYPTDCPHREKNGWTGDAHLAAETGLYAFDAAAAYLKWMNDIRDAQRPSGELPGIVPTSGWGFHWGNGPAWDSAYLLIPAYLYDYRGDAGVSAEHYAAHERYVDYLERRSDRLIVRGGLGDWSPARSETPVEVTSTAYFYRDARILAETARRLGRAEDATYYEELAEQVRDAFHRAFFDREAASYANGSQTALACALDLGLTPAAETSRVVASLVRRVRDDGYRLDTGALGTKCLLRALSAHGHPEVAYAVATQTEAPSWGHWIERGATTLWESWDGRGSRNHVLFADIGAWLYRTVAGLRPSEPGFRRFAVAPFVPRQLDWVEASHDSPYGRVRSAWRRQGGRFVLEVSVPVNTAATIRLPAAAVEEVVEGGWPLRRAAGVRGVTVEGETVVVEVGSGEYRFTVEPARLSEPPSLR